MNVLLMVADDLGYGDVDYNGGKHNTKGINTLAEHGVILNSFYGHHNCTPSRACFMTGRYASRYGLQEVLWPWSDYGLSHSEKMLSTKLKKAGYTNYIVGKWHLGYLPEYAPLARDFDYHYGCYATPHYYTHINYGGNHDWYRNGKQLKEEGFITDLLKEETLKVIARAKEPFFLYVPFTAPHKPILAPPDSTGDSYTALVRNLDRAILEIYQAFRKKNPDSMTIFCVDNGSPFKKSNGGLRGQKHTLFEGGLRLPAIVIHPRIKPGRCSEVLHAVDIYPTILKQCGLAPQANVDGIDMLPVIKGKRKGRDEILFNANGENWDGLRIGDYKYIIKLKKVEEHLFNIKEDEFEKKNLIGKAPRLEKSIKNRMKEFRHETINFLKTKRTM